MQDLIGKIIFNRYRVDGFIGRGGMAEVYKVWDQQRATFLAMKLLREDLAQDRIFLRRFQREADTLSKLQHPNIVRSYGLEKDGLLAFLLMDYVEGTSLRAEIYQLDGVAMSAERIRQILHPVCSALHYAHNMGLVHCDLKPGNVMIHKNGTVLLTDFGIARMSDAATATMVGMGTPAYMAPEQARGLDPTVQTDIYALGVVLFEMLTGGERPFTGEHAQTTGSTSEKVRWEQINLKPPKPSRYNPELTSELETVVLRCLEKEPSKRYPNVLELLNAFQMVSGVTEVDKDQLSIKLQQPLPETKVDQLTNSQQHVSQKRRNLMPWLLTGLMAIVAIVALVTSRGSRLEIDDFKPTVPVAQVTNTNMSLAAPPSVTSQLPTATRTTTPTFTLVAPTATDLPTVTLTPSLTFTQTPTSTPELGVGSTQISPIDGMVQMYVPTGEFKMGWFALTVYLNSYWIDQTEVTHAMYNNCVEGGACEQSSSPRVEDPDYADHPVIIVNWYDANNYCEWAGRRLPTEAEWEKAARGGLEGALYPWGNEDPVCTPGAAKGALWLDCSGRNTAPVGTFAPNGYGLHNMAGNVQEWVADWYDRYYWDNFSESLPDNPTGPASGEQRVLRGGYWAKSPLVKNAERNKSSPTYQNYGVGFRCAMDASP